MKASSGCLQLLEISWNLKTLLEIFWNLTGPPGNFCVRCRRSTALVSSHKNMDKYSLQKYEIYCHQMCFFQVQDAPKPIFGRGSAPDPCGGAYDAPPGSYSAGEGTRRAEIPIVWVFLALGVPSEEGRSKANMSWILFKIPPAFSWKSPENLLD